MSDELFIVAGAVWLALVGGSLWRLGRHPRLVVGELRDPVLSPFWALPWIVGIQLAIGFAPYGEATAKVVFVVFFVATILFGGWLTGQWIAADLDESKLHPGPYLPTVAGC